MFLSAFELFRIGPGPSSSATVGPQRAALRFVHDLAADGLIPSTARVEAEVYGGVAFSGRQQSTDHAIVAGMSGEAPERCDATAFALSSARVDVEGSLLLGGRHRVACVPERNARGGALAHAAATLAIRLPEPIVALDRIAASAVARGRAMAARYKIAALGGVAVNVAEC
jgi:hypothetical protein